MCVAHAILFDKLHQHEQHPELSLVRENKVRASFFMKAPETGEQQLFIKRYKVRGWQDVAKYIFLPLKAVSEWRNLRLLKDCGLPVPPPVAIGIKKNGVVLQDSCLIVEALLNTQPLNEYVAAQLPLAATEKAEALKQSLALSLARLAAEIHNKKIYYRDLHAGNILIRAEDNGQYQLFLIDLHRAWKPFALLEWMKIRDIAQLCNSLPELSSERRLFIGRYLKDTCSAPESFQSFNDKLEAMTCVCSVGLDMILIPGDTPEETISAIIADEAAIGMINSKTTSVRIIPVFGKKAGDEVEYGGLLGKATVMSVNPFSSKDFILRSGRIPAPVHSFRN
jgi:hypothetical protein